MSTLATHATWVLVVTFAGSLAYELWRATAKRGTSRYDSMGALVRDTALLYVMAAVVIGLLVAQVAWASWIGFAFSLAVIAISMFYYNPRVMFERRPRMIDWFEDLAFTGLLFVAATLLLYDGLGWTLQA